MTASVGTARAASFTKYNAATGLVDYTGVANAAGTDATSARTTNGYDNWGRTVSYTNDQGEVTTTAYNTAGQVATVSDPTGTTTYAYDGTDAAGKTEHRGLTTGLSITRAGSGGALTYKGAYNENGTLVRQDLPGGVTQITDTNELKDETGLRYQGQVTPVTATTDPDTGDVTWTPGTPITDTWLAWSSDRDGLGRVVREYTGAGAGFDGDPGVPSGGDTSHLPVGTGRGYGRAYTYSPAGQLASVVDRTAAVQIGPVDPTTGTPDGSGDGSTTPVAGLTCQVRTYGFNTDGARTSLKAVSHSDGDCDGTAAGTVTTSTATFNYDTANRFTTGATINGATAGAYAYDGLGRQTTVPAADTPNHGAAISLGYYVDDLPATATQAGVTTSFGLDSQGRRGTQTTTGGATDGQTVVRHYGDSSDNPAWSVFTPKAGAAVTTRYTDSLSGDLGAMITGAGDANIPLVDPRGNNVTELTIPAAQTNATACVGFDGWSDYTEYGVPATSNTAGVAGPLGYGWLGSKQRETSTEAGGLMLMGVRYYNPTTGAFTSPDPLLGGNDTSYGYPTDPVAQTDVSGEAATWRDSGGDGGGLTGGGGFVYQRTRIKKIPWFKFKKVTWVQGRIEGVYTIPPMGKFRGYTGQSRNVERRLAKWARSGFFSEQQLRHVTVHEVPGGKLRREVAEQRRLNYMNSKYGKTAMRNVVNPIGESRMHHLDSYSRYWHGL